MPGEEGLVGVEHAQLAGPSQGCAQQRCMHGGILPIRPGAPLRACGDRSNPKRQCLQRALQTSVSVRPEVKGLHCMLQTTQY